MRQIIFGLVLILGATAGQAEVYRDRSVPMSAQAALDINLYLGTWFEIARFPNSFERGCVGVTAQYSLRSDGQINVKNTCLNGTLDGPVKVANGVARIEGPGRLSVTFVPWLPFVRGDYWVLHLEPDYSVAVVGAPRGKTGWILARTPKISAEKRARAESALVRNEYNISKLQNVLQRQHED